MAEARAARMARERTAYPRWYLKRWHYLPEGYLSRRSIARYERGVRWLYNAGREEQVREAVVEALRRDGRSRIVEFGCGPGFLLTDAARALQPEALVGVDLSPFALEAAAARAGAGATLVHADARHTELDTGRYDAVVAMHVYGHVPEVVAAGLMAEAERLVRDGGGLYVVDHRWHAETASDGFEVVSTKMLALKSQRLRVSVRL
ncbi:MAG TPA: class I SAM-dependent methyltransferase [Tepidiformaceae bacterium]|nr:class I SAM-dependent methyltransferase [Tepidiformaceae bacterium]